MGSVNQVYKKANPNMLNASFFAPKEHILAMELLIERGIYTSKTEIMREGIRKVLKDNRRILESYKGVIEYVPVKRVRYDGPAKRVKSNRLVNNGYIIMNKDINED